MNRFAKLVCTLALMPGLAVAQNSVLQIQVVDAHATPKTPVSNARLFLEQLGGTTSFVLGFAMTNRIGQAEMITSAALRFDNLQIHVSGVGERVVYRPAQGLVVGKPQSLILELLPKGSRALLAPDQIEAELDVLRKRHDMLQIAVSREKNAKPTLERAMRLWATERGFSFEEVDRRFRLWADETSRGKAYADKHLELERQLKIATARRDYEKLIALTQQQIRESKRTIDEEDLALRQQMLASARQLDADAHGAMQADLARHDYAGALETNRQVTDAIANMRDRAPEETRLHELWAQALMRNARIRRQRCTATGQICESTRQSVQELREAVSALNQTPNTVRLREALLLLGDESTEVIKLGGSGPDNSLRNTAINAYEQALQLWPVQGKAAERHRTEAKLAVLKQAEDEQ